MSPETDSINHLTASMMALATAVELSREGGCVYEKDAMVTTEERFEDHLDYIRER